MDKREFFKAVYGPDTEGSAVIVLPNYAGKPTRDFWFNYPEQLDDMVELAEENKTGSVWYSPILFDGESRTKKTSKVVQTLAADADTCDPNNFRIAPSLTIQTSDGHWHVYWFLTEPMDPNEAAKINRRIAQVHKSEGCDTSFVNAAKLLRVPGTSNHKHPGDIVIVADYEEGQFYTREEIEEIYPVSEVPDVLDTEQVEMPDDLEQYVKENRSGLLTGLPNSIGLRDMLFKDYHEGKRSDVRWKLINELIGLGLDDRSVVAVVWDAPSNKYKTDPRGFRGLWDEVVKARQQGDDSDEEFEWAEDKPEPKKNAVQARTSFLTEEEIHLVKDQINFIDEWCAWAASKTDAPVEYHRAVAMMVMSAVYSEFGHATPKFAKGGLKLNLWFMVLGRSTKDRKSTARGYGNAALRALKNDDYSYSLGDDVTPSGISLALHDRANKASVFDRDEVQGLFKELLHQSYMTGGLEVFTKLYDGWSGGRVRASGEKKILESVPVSFIMFLMGILTESTDVLTVTNYRSGFLTRFIYVLGSRPDDYQSPAMEQDDEDDPEDVVFNKLIEHLTINRNYWEMMKPEDGSTVPIRADKDAWERLQEFDMTVQQKAGESQYAEIIETTSQRMVISTLKLATILAMDDRSNTVKLSHMLQAIAYAGEWFDNTVTVASMVSESEWQRDVDKLEQFINSKGGTASYAQAYRAFSEKRPFEFEEMISALQQRGILTREQQGSRWILKVSYAE